MSALLLLLLFLYYEQRESGVCSFHLVLTATIKVRSMFGNRYTVSNLDVHTNRK